MEISYKIAFLTEMGFEGKIPPNHTNMRTEFAWMNALNADHYNIRQYDKVKEYDVVFLIIPKGEVYLNAVGVQMQDKINPISDILTFPFADTLKQNNCNKIYYIQEGPNWLFNDYNMVDQVNFFNQLNSFDGVYAHSEQDAKFYKGLLPSKDIRVMKSLLIEDLIQDIVPSKQDKTIIGGNFARWYGGFQSYMVSQYFETEIWAQDSHCKRPGEEQLPNLNHFPRLSWLDWMKELSQFKYAVHLMPTVAAGTFSLNCAYFGIPCIGNEKVDTQRILFPELSVDVDDIEKAVKLAERLKNDSDFYQKCSDQALNNYKKYYKLDVWKKEIGL